MLGAAVMMTSHRDYPNDKEWSWLREPDTPVARHRVFEPSAEGKHELVLTKQWPHIVRCTPSRLE